MFPFTPPNIGIVTVATYHVYIIIPYCYLWRQLVAKGKFRDGLLKILGETSNNHTKNHTNTAITMKKNEEYQVPPGSKEKVIDQLIKIPSIRWLFTVTETHVRWQKYSLNFWIFYSSKMLNASNISTGHKSEWIITMRFKLRPWQFYS